MGARRLITSHTTLRIIKKNLLLLLGYIYNFPQKVLIWYKMFLCFLHQIEMHLACWHFLLLFWRMMTGLLSSRAAHYGESSWIGTSRATTVSVWTDLCQEPMPRQRKWQVRSPVFPVLGVLGSPSRQCYASAFLKWHMENIHLKCQWKPLCGLGFTKPQIWTL